MSIKAGDLRRVITLLRPDSTTDQRNRRNTVFADVVTYTIRWRDDITVSWRIRDHGAEYNILEINHLGHMRDYLRIKARQIARGGA